MKRTEIIAILENAKIDSPIYDADTLISHFCNINRASILAEPQKDYDSAELALAVRRRAMHEPLQYIIGSCDFCSETYEVNHSCLIPRADTEILVDFAVSVLPQNARFADLCTGSGCIAISTLVARPDCTAHAFDISSEALDIAKRNACRNKVADKIEFFQADLLKCDLPQLKYDMIISNPPYICREVIPTLSQEVKSEPVIALDGGASGMIFYERFIRYFKNNLTEDGCFVFEIGYDQKAQIEALASSAGMFCTVKKDFGGNNRMAVITSLCPSFKGNERIS
jgi:release factor glutamine methyltransferase